MTHVAISAIGSDRPGIVAAVTKVLVEQGCNLEDTSMSILRGHFAMMLVVAAPNEVGAGALEAALVAATAGFDLVVSVRLIDDDVPDSPAGRGWTVSVHGADQPGIVHRVCSALAEAGANVVDLNTRVVGDAQSPLYVMFLDVTAPADISADDLDTRLGLLADELGVSCSLRPADPDIL